jgi:hypothetical protein
VGQFQTLFSLQVSILLVVGQRPVWQKYILDERGVFFFPECGAKNSFKNSIFF